MMRGREDTRHVTARGRLHATLGESRAKPAVHAQCVRAGMAALLEAIYGTAAGTVTPTALWASTAVAIA